ncbi:MAG: hypothetical protein IPG45_33290 [Deltaproteobacteria bacterium]|nr:hypothetical protein [Deltaproteobacteria bacterium]
MSESELPPWTPGLEGLLQAEREAPDVDPAVADQVWSQLQTSITTLPGPELGAPSSGPSGAAASVAGAQGVAWLPVAVALVVGGVGGAVLHAQLRAPVIERVVVTVPGPERVVTTTVTIERIITASVAAPRPAPAAVGSRERALLERARSALARRDAAEALEALRLAKEVAPSGRWAEERDALEIRALYAAGRTTEARAAIEPFRRRYPESIFRPVVEAVARALSSTDPKGAPQ